MCWQKFQTKPLPKKNKMKKLILLFFSITLLNSCRSENSNDNPTPPIQTANCKISKISYGFFSGTRVYTATYNNGNLTELNSNVDKVVYSYDANNYLTKAEFFDTGNPQIKFRKIFIPNSNGQIIEQKNWEYYSGSLTYTGKETFTYNGTKLSEIKNYALNDTTIQERIVYEWTNDNPTKLKIYNGSNVLECENNITYDLTKENKFNSTYKYFMFQDVYDEDFNMFQFLGKNVITSHTNLCSNNTDNYNYTLLTNGLTDQVKLNGNLLWKFEYNCN